MDNRKEYSATIGLEIHAELNTNSKMFCDCPNDPFNADPNTTICSVCTAQPGTLPYVNKAAVKHVLRVGAAMEGTLADFTEFDRKNYFYPDIPKAYQISQYEYPLITGGSLAGVELTRIHLEEDTATSQHGEGSSLVNFNRAGVPLMELVTEPVIHDAQTAMSFAKELQLLLRTLGASHANLEKGEMRIEANISVSKTETFGTKVEVKNLNSFKIVGAAIDYEIARQIEVLEEGGEIVQETRGWNEKNNSTFSQRKKESADDYRYFPDPDIPKFKLSLIDEWSLEEIKASLPELPWETRKKLETEGLDSDSVDTYLSNAELKYLFDGVIEKGGAKYVKLANNYLTSDISGIVNNGDGSLAFITVDNVYELISLIHANELSSKGAKTLLPVMLNAKHESVKNLAEEMDVLQSSNEDELKAIVEKILAENPDQVAKMKAGDEKIIQFFVGQGMKETRGKGNPQVIIKLIQDLT